MTEKVEIPQEVADAIETLRGAEYSDYGVVKYVDDGGPIHIKHGSELQEVLRRWVYENDGGNSDLLLDALRIGYDIELKYKVGDWVANLDGSDFYPKGDVKAVEIALIEKGEYGRVYAHHGTDACWGTPFGNLRHATPEEIKGEKERQLWKSIGREVGKFKETDTGFDYDGILVPGITALTQVYSKGDLQGFYPAESFISFVEVEPNATTDN